LDLVFGWLVIMHIGCVVIEPNPPKKN